MKNVINYFPIILLNLCCIASFAKIDLDFSKKRGLYNAPFTLLISADQPNTTIRYTTDGSIPNVNNGNVYNGGIYMNNTTVLRVFAYNNIDQSNVRTHSYIFYEEVPFQPDTKAGFPDTGFAFDGSIVNNSTYANQLNDALLQIGTISIAINLNDFAGVYNDTLEMPASAEFIIPSTGKHKQEDCGIERFGGSSFNSHKRNFRLSFKSIYGDEKLSFPLFDDNVVNEFDQLALRAGHAGCLNNEGNSLHTGESNDIADQVVRDLQINMSDNKVGVAGNFMHVYFNGIYWGVYNVTERPIDGWAEKYFGGKKEDYDVIKTKRALDGNEGDWNTLVNFAATNNLANSSNYQTIQNYIDIDNFIDYILVSNYAPHSDNHPSAKNSFATNNRLTNNGFKFWIWDTEPAFDYYWERNWFKNDSTGSYPFDTIYTALLSNANFVMQTADHMECHCFNNGALTPSQVSSTYMKNYDASNIAMIAEAGRWANSSAYTGLVNAKNRIVNSYLPQRTAETINNYKVDGLYPNLSAVSFNQYGGVLANGASISLNNPNGVGLIHYTINRNDPRASDGAISSTAQTYSGSINLPNGVHVVKARVKQNSNWSAMCPRKFYVGQNYTGLVINEIHYNPDDSIFYNPAINAMDTVSGRNFEFVELKNTGNQDVYLEDVKFNKGITIKFEENIIVPPAGFIVIAEDAYWFQQKYGFAPDATYAGKLDNSGENIWLLDPMDNLIDTLRYDDNLPWDTIPDNGKYSLALIKANSDNANSTNWSSQIIYATPKAENAFCDGSLAFNPIVVDLSCNNSNDGFISGNATGGNAPYSYSWSNGATGNTINSLSAGVYHLTLTDTYGCVYNQSYTVTEPATLSTTVSSINQSYFQINDGAITVNLSGGTAPYSYNWSNNASTASISNLAPGNYTLNIVDGNSCSITENIVINAVDCSTLAVATAKTDEAYYQAGDGTATVNVTGGTSPYTFNWSNGATSSSITNLAPGSYTVDVLDNVGCLSSNSIVIQSLICNTLNVDVSLEHESCFGDNDGLLKITNIQNGTAPYTILWSTGSTSTTINNLAGGTYRLEITDSQGCVSQESYMVNAATAVTVNSNISNASSNNSNDGSIDLMITGGRPPYSYYWSTAANTEDINGLITGTYWVSVLDANNCQTIVNNIKVENSCPVSLVQQNFPILNTEVFQVEEFIQSNGMVNNNEQVDFRAGNYIELINDFEVMQGAEFEADIEGCQ